MDVRAVQFAEIVGLSDVVVPPRTGRQVLAFRRPAEDRPTPPNPGLTLIDHFRRALDALSGLPPTDHGHPGHYPLRDEESQVITDAEWQTQRERIAAVTDARPMAGGMEDGP